jgi:His-Xaa-Ser system radical SAM maturase HxsC
VLALQSRAVHAWQNPALVKVAGLPEFASGLFPVERMLLDMRDPTVRNTSESLRHLDWAGFLVNDSSPDCGRSVRILDDPNIVKPGDVIEIVPGSSRVSVRYRRGDNGNVLFATERCNSYCLMCSQPPREVDDSWRAQHLCELADLIDKEEPHLAISGGEPTLLGTDLLRVVRHCAHTLPRTHLHVLTNGRKFSEDGFARTFREAHPSLTWGVPLYGDHYRLHDYVVQRAGAFAETIRGLLALHEARQRVEIRIVLVKPTVERLGALARYIYRNLPFTSHVALMGIEPTGFAKANHSALWVDPVDMANELSEAVSFFARRCIDVSIYNLPLCCLPRAIWPYARRSISNWKQTYVSACEDCSVKERCAGVFGWITPQWTSRSIQPVKGEGESCEMH